MHSKRDNIKIMIYDQAEKDDCKKIEKNNPEISVNALYVDKMNIYPTCISKHNSNHEKHVILLQIANGD